MCLSDIARQLKRTAQKLERLARTWDLHDLEERSPGEFVAQPGVQRKSGKGQLGYFSYGTGMVE